MFTLARRVPRAEVRLAVPFSAIAAEERLCTLPGTLSASMLAPGTGVVAMTSTSGSAGAGGVDSSSAPALVAAPLMDRMRPNIGWRHDRSIRGLDRMIYSTAHPRVLDLRWPQRRVESAHGTPLHRS